MPWRSILSIFYGLFIIWTGLQRSIEAQAFKPNAFWFCLACGLLAIGCGFLDRLGKRVIAVLLGLTATGVVLAFYLSCLITQPEKDATTRVGLAIVASVAQLCVLTYPSRPKDAAGQD